MDSCFPAPVTFLDNSVSPSGQIVSWEWLEDGVTFSRDSVSSLEFSSRGLKEISLITVDIDGCTDTLNQMIEYDPPHDPAGSISIDQTLCFEDTYKFNRHKSGGNIFNLILKRMVNFHAVTYSDIA